MTEDEYLNVRELSHVVCASYALSYIAPTISNVIPIEEFETVKKLLAKWETDLYKVSKINQ